MAVQDPELKVNPYQSDVPLVQIPPQVIEGESRPAQPLPGQFGKAGTGALAIGDSILKGVMLGHQAKEQRKAEQAKATIAAADKSTGDAYQQYQDALSKGDQAASEAAYKNYVDIFNRGKAAKASFVIPEKPAKGKKKEKSGVPSVGGIKEWFEANPHLVPQLALATMQPKPPGMSRETKESDLRTKALETEVAAGEESLSASKERRQRANEEEVRAERQRQVEGAGGIEAVLASKSADPQMQQTARQMKFAQLDAQSPEAKRKQQFEDQLISGESKSWTPEQRVLAGAMGVVPQPVPQTITGRNGHQQQVLIDPTTNQPIPGSKPLDLGPPAWAQEFYAKRAADRSDMRKAVEGNPEAFGVTRSADPKAMKAAIDAKVSELVVRSEFGIQNLAGGTGKTGYEIQRDNDWLSKMAKEIKTEFPKGQPAEFIWTNGQKVTLDPEQMSGILGQFLQSPKESPGIYGFRDTVNMTPGKDPQATERDRQWLYQRVKNQMLMDKGKNALSPEQADQILKNTALGRSITETQPRGMTTPPSAPGWWARHFGGAASTERAERTNASSMPMPPSGPTKLYAVAGVSGPVSLTDEEVKKAKAAGVEVQDISSFNQ